MPDYVQKSLDYFLHHHINKTHSPSKHVPCYSKKCKKPYPHRPKNWNSATTKKIHRISYGNFSVLWSYL